MTNIKSFAVATAVMMMIMALTGFSLVNDDSDATVATGTFSIYVNDGDGWTGQSGVSGYDGAMALMNSGYWDENDSIDARTVPSGYGNYVNINSTYGDIHTFYEVSESGSNVWNVLVLNSSGLWVAGNSALGHYRPFDDYNASWAVSNIALYYGETLTGTDLDSLIADLWGIIEDDDDPIELTDLTEVTQTSEFEYTFTLRSSYGTVPQVAANTTVTLADGTSHVLVGTDMTASGGITVKGYGSDAFTAFVDAIGSQNLTATYSVPFSGWNPYSYFGTLFGLYAVELTIGNDGVQYTDDDQWVWWKILTVSQNVETRSAFNLGWYSSLSGAPLQQSAFAIDYSWGLLGDM